jgi:hypothetical protein
MVPAGTPCRETSPAMQRSWKAPAKMRCRALVLIFLSISDAFDRGSDYPGIPIRLIVYQLWRKNTIIERQPVISR